LKFKRIEGVLVWIDRTTHNHPKWIFSVTILIVAVSFYGISQIKALAYMVDDLPEKSEVKQDLYFFEENFSGVMPLEILIDTGQKKGVQNLTNLKKVDEFEKFLDSIPNLSPPLSMVGFVKASRQAYYNNQPQFYGLPDNRDRAFLARYLLGSEDNKDMSRAFVDSTGQVLRISMKMADMGSIKMDSLVNKSIIPKMNDVFKDTRMTASVTGSTLIFIKGNQFLIQNLIGSMIFGFFLNALIMGALFRNWKIIIISLIPNFIPLIITAGIMGLFGIALKPSTAIIFGIAFGIAVDNAIHFLAKYRLELQDNDSVLSAVSTSIRETGTSIIYTSVILFFGFVIFAASEFGGTVALGTLTSITLLVAMLTNLIVLPALLIQFDRGAKRKREENVLIESYREEGDAKVTD
jgi:predicted RND superfamily exporter protein